MVSVGMMKVPAHHIVHVVAVGNGLMSASRAVLVAGLVGFAGVAGRAVGRVRPIDGHLVLVHMIGVRMVKMAFVQIVRMVVVPDGGVTAPFPVNVRVPVMLIAAHESPPYMSC